MGPENVQNYNINICFDNIVLEALKFCFLKQNNAYTLKPLSELFNYAENVPQIAIKSPHLRNALLPNN